MTLLLRILLALRTGGVVTGQDSSLFASSLVRDWTGDHAPDTATLIVTGRVLDQAVATLTVRAGGRVVHVETWPTSYYLLVTELSDTLQRRAYVRRELERALTAHRLREDYPNCPAVAAADCDELKASSEFALGIIRGYENLSTYAWSKRRNAFVVIEGCC